MRPLGAGPLVVLGLVGLVVGWAVRPVSVALDRPEPLAPVWAVAVIWLLALAVAGQAWSTWRRLQGRRGPLRAYQAVNRLVLGQASALAGAAVFGGHLGTLISRIGSLVTELTDERLWRGGLSALGALVLLVAGLLLERACRIPGDRDDAARRSR